MEDDLWWKTTFGGRRPSVEDDFRWKTTYGGRRPSVEDDFLGKTILACCLVRSAAFFTLFVPFIKLKTAVSISQFHVKNLFKKLTTLSRVIYKNIFNMAHHIKLPANSGFSQISRPRLGHFSNIFLHWIRGFRTVILGTIKRYKRRKKVWNFFHFVKQWHTLISLIRTPCIGWGSSFFLLFEPIFFIIFFS